MNATALAPLHFDTTQARPVATPAARPCCNACGRVGLPTIDGFCVPHMGQRTEIWLSVVSPADLGLEGK